MANCLYCGISLRSNADRGGGRRDAVDWDHTKDHLYPKSALAKLTPAQRAKLPPDFEILNSVPCCRGCNTYKGILHPIDWLVIMPNSTCAARVAERLIEMGEDMRAVFDALRRRRK